MIPKPWIARLFNRTNAVCLERKQRAEPLESMATMETLLTMDPSTMDPSTMDSSTMDSSTMDPSDLQPGGLPQDAGQMPQSGHSKSSIEPEENDESDVLPI